jgi:hypothetical protein
MVRDKDRQAAESVFDRYQRRESELDEVVKQDRARHDAAMNNMQRLRALRIERDSKNQPVSKVKKRA